MAKTVAVRRFIYNAVFARRFLLLGVLLLSACSNQQQAAPQVELTGRTMGTTYSIKLLPDGKSVDADKLQQMIDRRLSEINAVMSTYDKTSELSRLNQLQTDDWSDASPELIKVLLASRQIHEFSGGAFDPSVGPLVNLWGFGPDIVTEFPSPSLIDERLAMVGFQRVKIDESKGRVSRPTGVYIDLSAIAKGYAVDEVAMLLGKAGYRNYLVEIGGELRSAGINARQKPWHIAIEKPQPGVREVHGIINVSDLGMVTSGDYRNFFEMNGQRYSHTLDPRTGYPVKHALVSVTVLADDCMTADALATAFMVMGPEQAHELAENAGIAAWFIEQSDGKLVDTLTPKMQSYRVN